MLKFLPDSTYCCAFNLIRIVFIVRSNLEQQAGKPKCTSTNLTSPSLIPNHSTCLLTKPDIHTRLDFSSKILRLNIACPTHGNNMIREHSAVHRCIRGKTGAWISFWPNVAKPEYMCINMYTYHVEPKGVQRQIWAQQQRAF